MQKLCKTPKFGRVDKNWFENLNQELLEDIVNQVKEIALLITNIILSLRSNSDTCLISYLISIKLLIVLVIMCKSAH